MGRPYSLDLRSRVVAAVASGLECDVVSERFEVSQSSIRRWVARARETGSPAAFAMGGRKPFSLEQEADWILGRLAEKPDITIRDLLAELHERKVDISYYGVWHFVSRSGLSFKKNTAR